MKKNLSNKVFRATKWSSLTELGTKLILPITNMILARVLTPEAFGAIALITMIITFIDVFSDAGFQKYMIQHEFKNDQEKYQNANVAFWTNLTISIILWLVIIICSDPLANLVGSPDLGTAIIVGCLSLPLTSFSSIQVAIYKREFDFKTLFLVRIIGSLIPFFITIPLALIGFDYWALLIGTITGNLFNAIFLTVKSRWKPTFFYDFKILKTMLSFSIWSLVESFSIWLTSWGGTFIVGNILNSYYLGIYKISMSTVNGILGIVTGATTSVLFSTLSRLNNDNKEYNNTFFKFQRLVSILLMPIGVGIYIYRDLITNILLGDQWIEASTFIGLWGLTSCISIIFSHYSSEVYRSKGKPKLSFLAQFLHLIFLFPVIYYSAHYSFTTLIYARSLVRFQFMIVHFVIMYFFVKISPWSMIKNVFPSILCSIVMGLMALALSLLNTDILWQIFTIILSAILYFGMILIFPKSRIEIISIVNSLLRKKSK